MVGVQRRMTRFLLGPLLALVLLIPAAAVALNYKPKTDESLSHVALIHYGDPKKIVYLTAANDIANPDKLLKGSTLWVPTVWKYRLKKGEDLSQIAGKYLKDPKRSDFLMWLNRIGDPKDVKPGTDLKIPFVLRHKVTSGQSLVDVAKRYYFDSRPEALLRKFNGLKSGALKPGDVVYVPIYDPDASIEKVTDRLKYFKEQEDKAAKVALKLVGSQPPVETHKQPEDHPKAPDAEGEGDGDKNPDLPPPLPDTGPGKENATAPPDKPSPETTLIQDAADLYREGDFELAQASLNRVLEKGNLPKQAEAEAREILAFCLVALDRPQDAEHEFVRLLMVAPERVLDPVTTSPKILEVFKRAKGVH